MSRLIPGLIALTLAAGCVSKAEHDQLASRVEALESKIETLSSGDAAAAEAASAEEAATALYREIDSHLSKAEFDQARSKLAKLLKDYRSTKAASRAIRIKQELDVIGKSVETPDIEKWFQGNSADLDLASGATLLVFWEVWCPHCKREVPKMQELYTKYQGRMDVVGLTKITKSATEEKVEDFIESEGVGYPIAKEAGDASRTFSVSGIPAAAIVKDGTIVWRGHPGKLTEKLIDQLIS